jgi:glycine dehydrogenase subunit 1
MAYIPNTDRDRQEMLGRIGVKRFEDLLEAIPADCRLRRPLDIPAVSELELLAEIERLADDNRGPLVSFAGGGVYDHFIPAAVAAIISRPEFVTAYTPYQAEVSQGTLQVIYEFQTHICRLTGMEVANASMYDGATAAAEAVIIGSAVTRRDKIIVAETVNPLYREVIATYLSGRKGHLVTAPMKDGLTDTDRLADLIDDETACVLIGQPNFFGLLEDVDRVVSLAQQAGARLIMAVDPIAQALLKTPAEYGADIVVGEGQPLGIPLSFGGPLLGFFAATKKLVRNLPGRLAARTQDIDGRTGFVLTLQTREQHIRREKATSNICTNQALCATAAAVYMSLLGRQGLERVAMLSAERARETARRLTALEGFELYSRAPFVREFPIRTPRPARDLILDMVKRKILPGVAAGRWYSGMEDCLLVALTEKRSYEDIEALVEGLRELTAGDVLPGLQE